MSSVPQAWKEAGIAMWCLRLLSTMVRISRKGSPMSASGAACSAEPMCRSIMSCTMSSGLEKLPTLP